MVFISLLLSAALLGVFFIYKFALKRKVNLFVLLILISLLPIWSIFREGSYQSGDLTIHTNYLQSFFANLQEGILVPQWAGGLCGGHGCPLFMFEYVTPYYIGSFFHVLGFSFLNSMKLFLAASYVLSGVTMFYFLRSRFKDLPAFTGSLLYLFAPIRFIEMHFRVSTGTDAAFIFIPLAFLFAQKSLDKKWMYVLLGTINFWLLILSHSSIAFVTGISSIVYVLVITRDITKLFFPIMSYILGLGLSAYYILPAIVLVKHTWMIFDQKVTEFHPLVDHLISPARFGFLFQGNNGEFRLVVGYAHLLVSFSAIYFLIKKGFERQDKFIATLFVGLIITSFLMLSDLTKPIWNEILFLRTFILPWRLLVPIAFFTAFLGSLVVEKVRDKRIITIFCLFIVFSTVLNWGNRKMVPFNQDISFATQNMLYTEYVSDPLTKMSRELYSLSHEKVIRDPYYVYKIHSTPINIIKGNGQIQALKSNQVDHEYLVGLTSSSILSENTYYFPGWNLYVNDKRWAFDSDSKYKPGKIVFSLPKGIHQIGIKFQDTPSEILGKKISIVALIILGLIALIQFSRFISKAGGRSRLHFPKFYH